ncbi:S41 family peptidase [Deinococcus radiomollis]|uniref:S41 family peptidase n=1 Tax=Deinococcus radiomollis TaxID=468916 RepID=UPI0038914F0D
MPKPSCSAPFRPRFLLGLVLSGTVLGGVALSSPASELFRAASAVLTANYFGWSPTDRPALVSQYAAALDTQCAPLGDACSFDQGRAVVKDMLAQMHDAHTSIRDAEGAERLREVQQDLTVPRTGLRVVKTPLGLLVVGVLPGSPAETAGVLRFDLLVAVNGQATTESKSDSAVPVASATTVASAATPTPAAPFDPAAFVRLERQAAPITVSLLRAGQPPRPLTLTTTPMKARDVPILGWQQTLAGRVAVIQYPTFLPADSAALFLKTLRQAQEDGAAGLVVDLRYNGGGRLDQCVQAASAFAPTYYQARTAQDSWGMQNSWDYAAIDGLNSSPDRVRRLFASGAASQSGTSQALWHGPAAILMDENTASCAEVFGFFAHQAGAILVGQPTKGVMNSGVTFFPLPDQGVMSVTMLRAYDLAGNPLPDHLEPDLDVPADLAALTGQGQDTVLAAALGAVQSRLAGGTVGK